MVKNRVMRRQIGFKIEDGRLHEVKGNICFQVTQLRIVSSVNMHKARPGSHLSANDMGQSLGSSYVIACK